MDGWMDECISVDEEKKEMDGRMDSELLHLESPNGVRTFKSEVRKGVLASDENTSVIHSRCSRGTCGVRTSAKEFFSRVTMAERRVSTTRSIESEDKKKKDGKRSK